MTLTHRFSQHGQTRVDQRGFIHLDVELVRRLGIQVKDQNAEVYFLRNKDAEDAISDHKQQIQRLERMRGCKVVFTDDSVLITAHHTSKKASRKLLRRCR